MGSKVLLADDSVTIQKVVGIIFANEDYSLEVVGNGDAALQKARETRPDVMLVDALMPGKDGYEVCQEVRRDPSLQHISLLLMTGAFDVVDEEKKRQSGADDFITKPFESQALLEVTARLISLSRDRAQNPAPAQQAAAPEAPQPVAAPPAAPPPPQPVAAPPAAPSASVDDIWGGDFAAGITDEAAAAAPAVAPVPAPVAAKADDDLWGVFDMDAVDATSSSPAAGQSNPPVTAASDDDFFAFSGEETGAMVAESATDEFVLEDTVSETVVEEPQKAVAGFDAFGEFDLEQGAAEPAPATVAELSSVPQEEDFSNISFDEPQAAPVVAAPSPPPAAEPVIPAAAPVSQSAVPVPLVPPEIPAPAVAPPSPVVPAPLPAAAPASLDEAQLKALLSNVSRDMIEKIVWEVVPDLAESIIREEIRKIKEGIGR